MTLVAPSTPKSSKKQNEYRRRKDIEIVSYEEEAKGSQRVLQMSSEKKRRKQDLRVNDVSSNWLTKNSNKRSCSWSIFLEIWRKHYGPTDQRTNGPTDRRTDRRTDTRSYRDARTHLISVSITWLWDQPKNVPWLMIFLRLWSLLDILGLWGGAFGGAGFLLGTP